MTAQKHLRDLLSEDQEPFILQNYIANHRRCHISRRNPATAAAINNLKPATIASFSGSNLCRSVCFSIPESPDFRRSPVPSFAPPCKTASLLLEAASRIQQKTDSASAAPMIKRSLFGSILKRLTQRNRRLKPEKDVLEQQQRPSKRTGHSRQSSAWWSESNGERSLGGEEEESTSGSDDDDDADVQRASSVISDGRHDWEFDLMDGQLCKSPFRSSSGHRSPVFSPPVAYPPFRHGKEEITRDDYEVVSPKKIEGSDEQQQDKEQTSPLSVLDPAAPFQDEEEVDDYKLDDDEDGYQDIDARDHDYNCSYANVQRAKQQLLEKLYRFERLAELDPVELEKIMLEQDSEDDDEVEISVRQDEEMSVEEFTKEVIKSRFGHMRKIPIDMRNLVSDLISEEWGKHVVACLEDRESLMKRVCEKIEWWKEVDSGTIDMMVEEDFRRSEITGGWKQIIAQQQIGDIVLQIEMSIFESLVTEFFHM